jgi:hypothetical protein
MDDNFTYEVGINLLRYGGFAALSPTAHRPIGLLTSPRINARRAHEHFVKSELSREGERRVEKCVRGTSFNS